MLQQQHKRMQSLVSDPQFIQQLNLAQIELADYQQVIADGKVFHGHTTKNTTSNQNIFTETAQAANPSVGTGPFMKLGLAGYNSNSLPQKPVSKQSRAHAK